ncbi:MAG: acetate--CoA ligase family protein [Acidimicrobiia bacterium]|nr:acetate--CoA ligase family protein [Acidimicrobiia bacterium]
MSPSTDVAEAMAAMLEAQSVAIVGASTDPKKVGSRPVDYLIRIGFPGRIYPVNPSTDEIRGLRCYPSLGALPEVPDVVGVVVSADLTKRIVTEAAELGVRAAVVITSGFGEIDEEGAVREAELAAIAREHGMLLVGPNSVGIIHTPNSFALTFTAALLKGSLTRPGGIGLVSQSGAFGTIIFALARDADLGLRSYVSTGNEAAFGLHDFMAGLVEDPGIRVVGGYVEAIRDGPGFVRAAQRAHELGKPVVLVKVGASDAGRAAASSHTGALAGNDDAYAAAFRRLGVVRAEDERHMLDVLDTFDTWYRFPRGRRVAVVSMSGGAGVLLCDDLDRRGLEVPAFSPGLHGRLSELLPRYGSAQNPVDLTGQFVTNPSGLRDVLEAIVHSGDVDAVMLFAGIGWTGEGSWAESVAELTSSGAPIMVVTQLAPPHALATLRAAGIPAFSSPIQASRVLSSVVEWTSRPHWSPPEPLAIPERRIPAAPSEAEAKAMLAEVGIPVPRSIVADTPDEAAERAEDLGDRVVVKGQGPGLEHKTDLGAIEVGLPVAEVAAACGRIADRVAERSGSAVVESYLVESLAPDGVDCVIGAVWEEPFGHLMMVGLGGTTVEVLGDVAFGMAPMDVEEAEALIRSLRAFPLLEGHRGSEPMDVGALAAALSDISRLCAHLGPSVRELDVNPVRVLPAGQGVVALDALVVGSPDSHEA